MPPALLNAAESRITRVAITIDNFGEINPAYFRGAQPEGEQYSLLASFGIKTVIDLRKDFNAVASPVGAGLEASTAPIGASLLSSDPPQLAVASTAVAHITHDTRRIKQSLCLFFAQSVGGNSQTAGHAKGRRERPCRCR